MRIFEPSDKRRAEYKATYDRLITLGATRESLEGYSECHHIVPKALGGTNDENNLVFLTFREHFLAHWLLTKFLIGAAKYRMCCAMGFMGRVGPTTIGRILLPWQLTVINRYRSYSRTTVYDPSSGLASHTVCMRKAIGRPVKNTTTGEIFYSITSATDYYGYDDPSVIRQAIIKSRKVGPEEYIFQFIEKHHFTEAEKDAILDKVAHGAIL